MTEIPLILHGIYDRRDTMIREAYWAGVKRWWIVAEQIRAFPKAQNVPPFGHFEDVPRVGHIADGLEFFTTIDDRAAGVQCARCGSSAEWLRCESCDHGDVGGDPDFGEQKEPEHCHDCDGVGGSYYCLSSRQWCEANPMPGREAIVTTALEAPAA